MLPADFTVKFPPACCGSKADYADAARAVIESYRVARR
jgi:hypothetical protein